MRIALIAPLVSPIAEPQVGGSQSVVADLARGFVRRGHDVVLYAPEHSRVDGVNILSLGIDSERLQDDVYQSGSTRAPSSAMTEAYRTIFQHVRSGDFDVIHSHGFDAPAITEGVRVGLSILHTLHLPPTSIMVDVIRVARSEGSTVWCAGVSHAHAGLWSAAVHIDHVLRNGVPVSAIPYRAEGARDAVIAARFSPEKGVVEGIEAARAAGWSVTVFGIPYDEHYEHDVRRRWWGDADVRFHDPVSRPILWNALGTAGVVLCLSHWDEPFGMVAAEAQAAGTPPVLIVVPASMVDTWRGLLDLHGLSWACRVVSVHGLPSQDDLSGYFGASLVVIDEAHRLRSRGVWYRKVMEILTHGSADKRVLLLTATPVNTGIRDLTTLLQVLTKNKRNVFAPAIADFEAYLRRVERGEVDPFPILDRAVVRRSRTDILLDYEQRRQAGVLGIEKPKLPQRTLFHVAYQYVSNHNTDLFDLFAETLKALRLAPYDLEPYEKKAQTAIDFDDTVVPSHAPGSLAALLAAGLLKRFESSLKAIDLSLNRLDVFLRRYQEALDATPPRLLVLAESRDARTLLDEERLGDEDQAEDFDASWDSIIESLPAMTDVEMYDIVLIRSAIEHDRAAIYTLRKALPARQDDGKIAALRKLFETGGRLHGKRCLVFTQFRDTARYMYEFLGDIEWHRANGIGPVALVDGDVSGSERARIAATFDPDVSSESALYRFSGQEGPPQLLVSTDVLAEGHNLQLAEAVVNFDLHWNPQVVVQRSGRIDRLNSPHERVMLLSFLPEEGLEKHLKLVQTLDARFHLNNLLGLGDEPVTKLKSDLPTLTFEQMANGYADKIARHYGDQIVAAIGPHPSEWGPQVFFRIRL
jgi:glycosyltransferase involved in cell wall biosynthesis/superfamily II DNA or RNA helicase